MREPLHIIKIGGFVIDQPERLKAWLENLALTGERIILVHGGGRAASRLSEKLEIPIQMVEGRRVTDAQTIEVVTMVYAGLINKSIVAMLNAFGRKSLGICGADLACIPVKKRSTQPLDFGFVGDILQDQFPVSVWENLMRSGYTPVVAPISADFSGMLLNINADTMAHAIASGLSKLYETHLWFAFEKSGVLLQPDQNDSVIPEIRKKDFEHMKSEGTIHGGMLPKLQNAFQALDHGVVSVHIGTPEDLLSCISGVEKLHTAVLI